VAVSSDEAFPRQLTAEGQFRILHVFLSLLKCVKNNFQDP